MCVICAYYMHKSAYQQVAPVAAFRHEAKQTTWSPRRPCSSLALLRWAGRRRRKSAPPISGLVKVKMNHGQNHGKTMGKPWKTMENHRKTIGKR